MNIDAPCSALIISGMLLLGLSADAYGQGDLTGIVQHPESGMAFPSESVPSIHVICGDAFEWMMQEENWYSDFEHPATFIFQSESFSDTVSNVGFRLRGNTSRAAGKKSFKISFNTFEEEAAWQGLQKMNLNGEHNDPSIMRARLVWECFRDAGIPVSRSTHVQLYVNEEYMGLYSHTEHIDNEWLDKRFEQAHGNLWKCTYPATLTYISNDPDAYKFTPSWSNQRVYELKTNEFADNYQALGHFIDVLNNTPLSDLPCALEDVFDVDAYLKVAAGEILVGHWDNYIGNKNNFYLYQRQTDGRLVYLPYDADNTLGVQWFGEWTNQDIHNWTNDSDRPLYTRLLDVPEYRDRFDWYVQWWMDNFFVGTWMEGRSNALQTFLGPAVENDTYYPIDYGFEYPDFGASATSAWGGHVAHGLTDFVNARVFWAEIQLDLDDPTNHPISTSWANSPASNDTLTLRSWLPTVIEPSDWLVEAEVTWPDETITWHELPMAGTTLHGSEWKIEIPLNAASFAHFRVKTTSPDNDQHWSPCQPQKVWNSSPNSGLVINELMPKNNSVVADESGAYEDWVELFNHGAVPINTSSYFLTNRLSEPARWQLPNVTLDPGQHLLIWCDDDPYDGPLHASFTMDAAGDNLFLTGEEDGAWRIMDEISWTDAPINASWGRTSDGAEDWTWFFNASSNPPTPNNPNGSGSDVDSSLGRLASTPMIPNPCVQPCVIHTHQPWKLHTLHGVLALQNDMNSTVISGLPRGMYIIEFPSNHSGSTLSATSSKQTLLIH